MHSENSKRIAKNTLFLYFRGILTLAVALYTSREVLAQLGISDFGIYNIVSSVIVLFSFILHSMGSVTTRFFTFDLGKGDFEQLEKTFRLSIILHIFTALIILILGETLGFYFLNSYLNIPIERMEAANFIYQFSIISICISILQAPYIIAIIAHERMKVFAYAGLLDAVLKLAAVLALGFAPIDKLKFYSILLFSVNLVMFVFYVTYCHRNFKETHFKWFWNKEMLLDRMTFGWWSILSEITSISAVQGVNMLLNMFCGVIVNAAYGIMTQVSTAMNLFANNFLVAVEPQITKSYAKGDINYLHSLLFHSVKFSFLISFFLTIPLVLNMDFVLHLWLKTVPEYAVGFCKIRLVDWTMWMLVLPLSFAIAATGKIKYFMIIDSIFISMNFILSYIFLSQKHSPISIPYIYISVNILRCVVYLFFVKKMINLSIAEYFNKVFLRLLITVLISIPLPMFISFHAENWTALFATSGCFVLLFLFSSIFLGLNKNERTMILNLILPSLRNVKILYPNQK
ncbi:MAG: hypothetical protein LBC75_04495 [Fibromonadaceae bacterium]|jgi:Na+-driven multidrug efflux pump|nr:hypothetical protein [Fibromonadaceae bacterium]